MYKYFLVSFQVPFPLLLYLTNHLERTSLTSSFLKVKLLFFSVLLAREPAQYAL
jgi:hypothetical protein